MQARRRRLLRLRRRGYSLVALVVALIVMNIAVTAALGLWSTVIQREKEQELIFRGLQYAEAIRVFQQRFNRPPNSLEELLEVEPRSIRQLWTDPISDSGNWQPILAGEGTDVTELAPSQGPGEQDDDSFSEELDAGFDAAPSGAPRPTPSGFASDAEETEIGPIEGVRPTASGEAMKLFLGQEEYQAWEFRAELLGTPQVSPEGVPLSPRLDPDALGRPWPQGLQPQGGSAPHSGQGKGEALGGSDDAEADPFGDDDPFDDDPFGDDEDGDG